MRGGIFYVQLREADDMIRCKEKQSREGGTFLGTAFVCVYRVWSVAVCDQILIHFRGQVAAVEQLVIFRDLFLQIIFGIAGIQQLAQPQHA